MTEQKPQPAKKSQASPSLWQMLGQVVATLRPSSGLSPQADRIEPTNIAPTNIAPTSTEPTNSETDAEQAITVQDESDPGYLRQEIASLKARMAAQKFEQDALKRKLDLKEQIGRAHV